MWQKKIFYLLFLTLTFLSSCSHELPSQMPDIGKNGKELEYNAFIKLSAPKELNSYKSGESVNLELVNLTQNKWTFNVTEDIFIYQYEKNEWKKISDTMVNIGATELFLESKGSFPLDKQEIGVLPDLKKISIRICDLLLSYMEGILEIMVRVQALMWM
jgi:hypothetical protein